MSAPQPSKPVLRLRAGDWLVHWVLPVWIALGAALKLFAGSPAELPEIVLRLPEYLWDLGIRQNDYSQAAWQVFMLVIGVEFVVAILLALHRAWARPLAVLTLLVFIGILINAMQDGKASCGCFGTVTTPPWVMLTIDVAFLLGCLVLPFTPRAKRAPMTSARWAAITLAACVAIGGSWLMFKRDLVGTWGSPAKLVQLNLLRAKGRPWRDVMLFKELPITPASFAEKSQVWVIYRDTCPACHALFQTTMRDEVPGQRVVAVRVPTYPPGPAPVAEPGASGPVVLPAHITGTSLKEGVEYQMLTPIIVTINGDVIADVSRVRSD